MELENFFSGELNKLGLKTITLSENNSDWNKLLNKCKEIPIGYSISYLNYQYEYYKDIYPDLIDLSRIIYWQGQQIAVWPISISLCNFKISSQGLNLLPPLYAPQLDFKSEQLITNKLFKFLKIISNEFSINSIRTSDSPASNIKVSAWGSEAMNQMADSFIEHDLVLDLNSTVTEIFSNFEYNLRREITKGSELWTTQILNYKSKNIDSIFNEFQSLHLQVAGKKTRSDQTWELQKNTIIANEGFLVYSKNTDNRMIGCAYFMTTSSEALYSVGAYDRTLFKFPIGQVIQFESIKEMISRDLKLYKIGSMLYPQKIPSSSIKELNISKFKSQFASHKLLNITYDISY